MRGGHEDLRRQMRWCKFLDDAAPDLPVAILEIRPKCASDKTKLKIPGEPQPLENFQNPNLHPRR